MERPEKEERVYMISGTDENGDEEMFVTMSRERADARLLVMRERLKDVTRNAAWDND